MVNKKFYLGILAMVLVFGMTVVGNLEAQTDNGGEFILTDIPAKYNGKYAVFPYPRKRDSGQQILLASNNENPSPKLFRIEDGKVIIPLWVVTETGGKITFERYSGNDLFSINIFICEEAPNSNFPDLFTKENKVLETVTFDVANSIFGKNNFVQFSNGSATRSYNDKSKIK
jgi:hypothetical protein